MVWLPDDKTLHAANLPVCAGTLATPVGMLAAGGAAVAGALSIKEISKRLNTKTKPLAETLRVELAKAIADISHFEGEASIIVPQMIEASLPTAQIIIDTGQKVDPLLSHMLAVLKASNQPDYTLPANVNAFKKVMLRVLTHLLHDPAFTAQLAPLREQVLLEMRDMLAEVQGTVEDTNARVRDMQATLENVTAASRDQLEALANRFDVEAVYEKSDADLRQLLTKKAEEYRALKAEVDAIPDTMRNLANLKAAAQDAIARVDLDEVEHLMTLVHTTELEEAAKSAEIRADTALLRGNVTQAATLLAATADSFIQIDPIGPARKRILEYFAVLYDHGLRYGGQGLQAAEQLLSACLTSELKDSDPRLWAGGQNNLANTLANQGIRTEGAAGADLLAQAVTAYRAALEVRTRADHPVDWAMTQNNVGGALQNQGARTEGAAGADLLAQAFTAYRAALEVRTRADHPLDWAMTQNNLAVALEIQGARTEGVAGADLLAQAVTAYRAALEVRTRADHPVQWAMTQNNLAGALKSQGTRTEGAAGADLLAQAVTAYGATLEVTTRADHPVDWAMTQNNIAIAQLAIADHDSCTDPKPALQAALIAVENALSVYDPVHMSYRHAEATRLRDDIQSRLDALDT